MKTYCMIYELKPECVNEYIKAHQICPDWQVKALRECGAYELEIYMFGNYCIITYICAEDFDTMLEKLSKSEDNARWQKLMNMMFKDQPVFTGEQRITTLPKIFSLKEEYEKRF